MKQQLLISLLVAATISHAAEQVLPTDLGQLETMVIIGEEVDGVKDYSGLELAGAQDILTRDELEYEHPDDTLELFSKLPGINVARYNQGIINTDIGIRGFGTDGVTPHAKLLIDGIPSNIHNGYNELDQLFPLAIGSIQVFKGTSDVRYGLYNVAGSYNVFTRTDISNDLQVTVDTFGSKEFQVYTGHESGALTHNYFLGYRDGDGYRDHTDLEKYSVSGRWAYDVFDDWTVGLSIRFSGYEGDSPGYLDRATAASDPTSSPVYASQDGGDKEVNQFSVFAEKITDEFTFSIRSYFNDVYRNRFVRFSAGGSLRNRIDDQQIAGFASDASWNLNDSFRIKAGLEFQNQEVDEKRYNAVADASSPTGYASSPDLTSVRRDRVYDLQNLGAYLGFEHDVTDAFRWNAGLRFDKLYGDFEDRRAGTSADIEDFGILVQPKLNVFYDLKENVTLFANYGRTFQAPIGSALYSPGSDVSYNDGGELGIAYQPNSWSTFRLSAWYQLAENEYQDDQINYTGYREVGEVERRGVEFAFNYRLSDALNVWGNYAATMSEIREESAVYPGTKGNEVRGTPNYTYSAGASYALTDALIARFVIDGQGDYYVNENNEGGKFGDYLILGLGADYITKFGTFSVQVNNLTDESYEYVYDFSDDASSTIHSPGDGINASFTYSLSF